MESEAEEAVETLLDFLKNCAGHRFENGINSKFLVRLAPINYRPAWSKNLRAPINLRDDIVIKLANLIDDGIMLALPFSKIVIPILPNENPTGKHANRKVLQQDTTFTGWTEHIDTLIIDDCIKIFQPNSTKTEAVQHMTMKHLICKACHCLELADQKSIEMLA